MDKQLHTWRTSPNKQTQLRFICIPPKPQPTLSKLSANSSLSEPPSAASPGEQSRGSAAARDDENKFCNSAALVSLTGGEASDAWLPKNAKGENKLGEVPQLDAAKRPMPRRIPRLDGVSKDKVMLNPQFRSATFSESSRYEGSVPSAQIHPQRPVTAAPHTDPLNTPISTPPRPSQAPARPPGPPATRLHTPTPPPRGGYDM